MKLKIALSVTLYTLLCFTNYSFAQFTLITPGDSQANITAHSDRAGIEIPQISLVSLTDASPVLAIKEGTIIYNTNSTLGKGIYYWDNTKWIPSQTQVPEITASSPLSIVSNNIKLNAGTFPGQLLSWDGNNWVNTMPKPMQTLSNMQPYLALNYCIALYGIFPSRNGADPFVGEIGIFAFNFPPLYWAQLNGQLLSIQQNQALFALIGTYYGGNGIQTFALPDLRGRTPIHAGQGPGLTNRTHAEMGGSETIMIDNKY